MLKPSDPHGHGPVASRRISLAVLAQAALCLLGAYLLASCGNTGDLARGRQDTSPAGVGYALLPAPSALGKHASVAELRIRAGADYDTSAPANRVQASGAEGLAFSPQWQGPQAGPGGMAYAMYRFTLADPPSVSEAHAAWDSAAKPAAGNAWLGLSYWAHNCWAWFELPADGVLNVPQMARYADGTGAVLGVVLVLGSEGATLNWLRLGGNAPPVVSITLTNASGRAPREVSFDGSASRDLDGSIINYEWDWWSDGHYDLVGTGASQGTYKFWLGGTYMTTLRVTDNEGLSATGTAAFALDEHSDWWKPEHDRMNTRHSPAVGPQDLTATSVPEWEFDLGDGPLGVLLGLDGTVYAGSRAGVLYEIDATTGGELHRFTEGTSYIRLDLIGPDGTVYALIDNGSATTNAVVALNPDLSERWRLLGSDGAQRALGFGLDGSLLMAWGSNELRSIDPETRGTIWTYPLPEGEARKVAVGDEGSVFCSCSGTMAYGVKPDGSSLASYWPRAEMDFAPVINADHNIILAAAEYVVCFAPGGTEKWYFNNSDNYSIAGMPALGTYSGEERFFVPLEDVGGLYSLRPDGSTHWHFLADHGSPGNLLTGGDGNLYFGARSGWLECIKPNKNPKWAFNTGQMFPEVHAIAADGTLYASTQGDYVLRAYHD